MGIWSLFKERGSGEDKAENSAMQSWWCIPKDNWRAVLLYRVLCSILLLFFHLKSFWSTRITCTYIIYKPMGTSSPCLFLGANKWHWFPEQKSRPLQMNVFTATYLNCSKLPYTGYNVSSACFLSTLGCFHSSGNTMLRGVSVSAQVDLREKRYERQMGALEKYWYKTAGLPELKEL